MKRFLGNLKSSSSSPSNYADDSPEGIILREVSLFCESGGGPNSATRAQDGNGFVHLPAIVEAAESSPVAAKEAAHRIRKILSNPASPSGYIQYNAIMLIRILVDNPGHTFTRNLDAKFVNTVRELVKNGRDMGVQRFLRETLDALELQRSWDEDLSPIIEMWKKEKAKILKGAPSPWWPQPTSQTLGAPGRQNYYATSRSTPALPPPDELAARVSEAKMSAKLLLQFVQSTPPAEIPDHELIKEFYDRCRSAVRSVQEYIHSTNPAPDEDTLLTLIETNDELSVSLSKYQRSLLTARKAVGSSAASSSSGATPSPTSRPLPAAPGPASPPVQQRRETHSPPSPVSAISEPSVSRFGSVVSNPSTAGRQEYRSEDFQVQNPFADTNTISERVNERPGNSGNHDHVVSPVEEGWSNGVMNDMRNASHKP